jgi:hypothetical protein
MDMRRFKSGKSLDIIIVTALLLGSFIPACRKEAPPLDRNRAPRTFITSAPPETTEADYRVHMYWRGTDEDGIVTRYIWYISDTVMTLDPIHNPDAELVDWNPEARRSDYVLGRFTAKNDSIFIFEGFDESRLALVNRQAFHIAAIDDAGKIDPSPARLQFLARVTGIPTVEFWTMIYGEENPFDFNNLDTISMGTPFSVKFLGSTVNNAITGYRWSYEGNIYPDYNNDGITDWLIPNINPPETVQIDLANTGEEALADGIFYFKVIARDEAGALSASNILTGDGVCVVVINHDPNTKIIGGQCFFAKQTTGEPDSMEVDFSDGIPDTLPYKSRIRFDYLGWDDPKDAESNQQDPPVPIRFQFRYQRQYKPRVAYFRSSWIPQAGAEDTNPGADLENDLPTVVNRDSTTMSVGSFDYEFYVRSFDEEYRADGTPDTVKFVSNFPPKIDSIRFGYLDNFMNFVPLLDDTVRLFWGLGVPSHPNAIQPYDVSPVNMVDTTVTVYYSFYVKAGAHDHWMDPPGSGIKGWSFSIYDPDFDYYYKNEGEWIFDQPVNAMLLPLLLRMKVHASLYYMYPDSVVNDPPPFMGEQVINLTGKDISDTEITRMCIRGITPDFDDDGNVIPGNYLICQNYRLASVARLNSMSKTFYIELMR